MGKISILPEAIANKIAAGEVVQRPESVVKELLENSLDAGSTKIDLLIKKAGKSLIQVIDDGEGMSEDDVLLCVQKHATSKIRAYNDLEAIYTFGFRGEALSAIAAVSQIEIKTQMRGDELGILMRMDGSTEMTVEKGAFPPGTSVAVKNLFFNTPARRNFLRSDTTELKHIVDTFNRLAMVNPNFQFRLFIDDELILDYPAGERDDRVLQVFGEPVFRSLFYIEELTDYLSLRGFVGKPSLVKKTKGDQYLFINRRIVNSKQISHAVFAAYENILDKGEYPFYVLFLTIDPAKIDINVHPAKLEVRFENEKDLYAFILTIIKKGLADYDLIPKLQLRDTGASGETSTRLQTAGDMKRFDMSDRPDFSSRPKPQVRISDNEIDALFSSIDRHIDRQTSARPASSPFDHSAPVQQIIPSTAVESPSIQMEAFLVQLQNKYIITPIKSGLMIIDQHVAHERILYERALRLFTTGVPLSQQLLFPKTVQLDPGLFLTVKEIYPYLSKLGFEIKFLSRNTIAIEGVPQEIQNEDEERILREIADEYINNQKIKKITDSKDNLAKSFSCKSAIKAGDKLNEREMRILIDELFATSMPYVCPHGRPIVIKISIEEFDRRFGRT
jgi:DNA mismatch repair protein MutL